MNEPLVPGVEHVDHRFQGAPYLAPRPSLAACASRHVRFDPVPCVGSDLVSEFIWLRTDQKKQFFVREPETAHPAKHFVRAQCIW